jgi:thioredoxin reductase
MIAEDEKTVETIDEILDLSEAASTVVVEAPEFSPEDYVLLERVLEKNEELKYGSVHKQLNKDLVEHIWNRKGRRFNKSTN